MGISRRTTMWASRITASSVISKGYGEKTELQDLNKILEDSLKEMQDLQESTAEFEKQIAHMEEQAERQVKQRCAKIERHNQGLKTQYRTEGNDRDHLVEEKEELERQIDVAEAKRNADQIAVAEATSDTERLVMEIETQQSCFPDLRAELKARQKENTELRKTLKAAEVEFTLAKEEFDKKAAECEQIGKKHQSLSERLYTITSDGKAAAELHSLVIQRLENILGDGPGDLDGEWQMLKDALKEEHELELQTLTEEKTLKWRFELNKLDHEITSAGTRLADAKERKHQADMDLGAMQQEKKELEDELARLRLQLEAEAADEAYNPNVLDELIKELEALIARKEADIKRVKSAISALEKQLAKLESELAALKKKSAAARLDLAWERVMLQKAIENCANADARQAAEKEDADYAAQRLSGVIKEKQVNIKDLNDAIAELKQLEMDVAGLRAEIDKYSVLLESVPDPAKGWTPGAVTGKQVSKRRRTETTEVVEEEEERTTKSTKKGRTTVSTTKSSSKKSVTKSSKRSRN